MTADEHEKRSQALADSARRVATTLNGGAIGVAFTVYGVLYKAGEAPTWPITVVPIFVLGLVCTITSLMLAKHRELKRRDAAIAGRELPKFPYYMHSYAWEIASFIAFGAGALLGSVASGGFGLLPAMYVEMMTARRLPALLNTGGLVSGFIGVLILWRYGLPEAVTRGGFGYVMLEGEDRAEKAKAARYDDLARFGLLLIALGFLLQLIALWI